MAELKLDKAFVREMVAASGVCAAIVVGDGGTVVLAAGQAAFFGGRPPESAEGGAVSELFAAADWPRVRAWMESTTRTGGLAALQFPGAAPIEAAISVAPVQGGSVLWIRGPEAAAATRERERLESVGRLAAGIAHGFNNLLTGILGNLRMVGDGLGDTPAAASVENATRAAERAADLTRELLLLAAGGPPVLESVAVADAILDMSHLLQTALPAKVAVRLDVDNDLPAVSGDPVQIRQAILTLMMNGASSIGSRAGTLMIRATAVDLDAETIESRFAGHGLQPGRAVLFEVRDTGPGAAAADLPDGLASLRESIRDQGGALVFESAPGQGTTFRIVLPAAGEPRPVPQRSVQPRPMTPHPNGTVLVVDDEDMVTRLARSILSKAGYPVLVASSGEEALNLFEAGADAIALVILDLTMAGSSCEEILERMRRIKPDLPVTISSGYPESDVMKRFRPVESVNFLQKPFTKAQLLDRVAGAIGVAVPR